MKLSRLVKAGKIKSLGKILQILQRISYIRSLSKEFKGRTTCYTSSLKTNMCRLKNKIQGISCSWKFSLAYWFWMEISKRSSRSYQRCSYQCKIKFDSSQKRILEKQNCITTQSSMKGRISQSQIGSSSQRYWYICCKYIKEIVINDRNLRLLHKIDLWDTQNQNQLHFKNTWNTQLPQMFIIYLKFIKYIKYMLNKLLIILLSSLFFTVIAENQLIIAFGSCFKFYRTHDTDVFKRIQSFNPKYFLWLGDAAYIDYMHILGIWKAEQNETRVKEKFDITKNDKYYTQFKKSVIIKGVYDDHDSNQNNGGKLNPLKESAKQLYLDFIDEPYDSPLRKQDGIYQSFYADQHNKILIVMTDTRYNSDKLTGDSLGENQWKWLEQQFQTQSQLIIMTSGIQVMHDDRNGPETWFAWSKQKLYTLIKQYNKPIIFLSGDVHYSEIMKHPCPHRLGQNIYEFTSSGMTFSNQDHLPFIGLILQFLFPPTFSSQYDHYYKSNFGILKIITNDQHSPIKIAYETHSSEDSSIVLQKTILIEELQKSNYDESQFCILDIPRKKRKMQNYILRINENILIVIGSLIIILLFIIFLIYNFISYVTKFKELYKQIQKNKSQQKLKQE